MKKKIKDITPGQPLEATPKKITRKEAIKKAGYIALSSATMMILLSNPSKVQAAETSPAPVDPWTP